eukprot:157811_1
MHDIILPQEEPTKPEMRAPRPMLHNNNNNNKKDRHTYSYSYHKVNLNISRTDLGIDASGDDTSQLTTSGSEDNTNDALDSSSDSGTVEIHNDLSDGPFNNNNNSSQGSSPSPNKQLQIEKRSSDFKEEIVQRKLAMDNHYFIPYKYKIYFYWYFVLFICICVLLIMIIGSVTFDKTLKFINKPKYNKHSFLREECMNNNNNNNNKDGHTYSYSYHKVNLNISRTDLGIDASGD